MIVSRCMSKHPITVSEDTSVPEAQAIMRREKVNRLPVFNKKGDLAGIVTFNDLAQALPSHGTALDIYELHYLIAKVKVADIMKKNVLTITEDVPVEEAARIMSDNDISGLPVMRDGKLVGIITESDLFELFIELFGARHQGVRLTVLVPEKQGELAAISTAIAEHNGNIISFASFDGDDPGNYCCTLKVAGIERDTLVSLIEPLVEKVLDVR